MDVPDDADANETPDVDDVPELTQEYVRTIQVRMLETHREPLLPENEVTECPVCGGEMVTTNNLRKAIPTPHGLTVVTPLPGARCARCSTSQYDPAALALILEHSDEEIIADYETTVTQASGKTLGTYFKKDLSRVLSLTGKEHLRWTVLDEDHALVEIDRGEENAEA